MTRSAWTGSITARFPGSADEVPARVAELCDLILEELNAQTSALVERMRRARRAPEVIAGVRADAAALGSRVPHAYATIPHLATRYDPEALPDVSGNVGRPISCSESPSTASAWPSAVT
ncbi:hypothetical protein [Agromyces humi]|uniref:hypothetical protein n=1 Tax=Agromyces humi TaxID=1766800 RepID=UPI00135A835C|nr:hypothetical protein [Agromyces humi]